MLFVISCTDKPGCQQVRLDNRPDHVAYLKGQGGRIVAAGPTTTEDGAAMTGSVIIIELDDYAQAEDFARNDPYAKAGLFDTVSIRPWKKVLPAEA
jgi:uncharacterized protein YciI